MNKLSSYIIFILVLISCGKTDINAPNVDFRVSQSIVVIGYPISFFDKTTNEPKSWLWDFGDGNTSIENNPSHTYEKIGTYTICLTCSNNEGENKKIKENYITVKNGDLPSVDFEINREITDLATAVKFNDKTTNETESWLWDFGDGNTSTEQNPTHLYAKQGIYSIGLTVINRYGQNTMLKPNLIEVYSELVYDIEGNLYRANKFGDQYWFLDNLKVKSYPDGKEIMFASSNSAWANLSIINDAYCSINDNEILYTWAAAINSTDSFPVIQSPVQGVCPDGWHLPNFEEWNILKEEFFEHNRDLLLSELNLSSGGIRFNTGEFNSTGDSWWLSQCADSSHFAYYFSRSIWGYIEKNSGLSIRCIKDNN